MLFRYGNKVYIKPFADKLVEVEIIKKGDSYDVKPTDNKIIITQKISGELYSIDIKEAYKIQSKNSFEKN